MRHLFKAAVVLAALFAVCAGAQDWYHDRDERYRAEQWRAHLFSHVRMDLEHVQNTTWPRGGDHYRLERTRHELDDLQALMEHHHYDERELNDVIGSLSRVVADNRMGPRDREILNDDLNRMRDYRQHHDHWMR